MATHFARGIFTEGHLASARLLSSCHIEARDLLAYHRARFLTSRGLLVELTFMLYGTSTLSEIVTQARDKPVSRNKDLLGFSIPCAGNIAGVALTTEGTCGLDMELQRAIRGFHNSNSVEMWRFSSNENLWINGQNDPNETRAQLTTSRQNILKSTGDVCNDDPCELQLLPDAGRLKCTHVAQAEATCDAEDVLAWPAAVTPIIEKFKVWESDGKQDWKSLPDTQTRTNEPTSRLIRFSQLCATKSHTF